MNERDENNRKLQEWLTGKSLNGFGIFHENGSRLRTRDFDSMEEAQRYIDSEDERLTEPHKSNRRGVVIQPCIKAHPDFYTDPAANEMLLEKMHATCQNFKLIRTLHSAWGVKDGGLTTPCLAIDADRKTAICEAALRLIESERVK